ncbi:tyrosine protein kinase [Burkholderia stagnalis]|uniref:Tyrosine protein kinase n=2 Tax=Burkholderia stagnalis TaxID=1503054 RepID=A0ABX9YD50_9BURK|nr:polysaccharide biosynthesis tyrosine autokinase [Burkholderia stagnalis]RQQ47555.1 tyrosine protein kinase [Burkholderia stagnalis]RQQ59046.1 tyrosine protein kinase [Burkholderia stagnalis]RQQ59579.1 tyrosine protein kinase [Burkholderia stagnalis]RQQ73880.1 tyrosine protein kinase [Burkholderia stagnalis]RQQ79666.1 tyrosine protein kinase [Burkholderia stagnalis]
MSSVAAPPDDRRDELDLVSVLDILLARRRWIITATLLGLLVGALGALLLPPRYQSDMMIQVESGPEGTAANNLVADVSALFDVKSSASAEAQIVASRLVVTRAVDRVHHFVDARPKRFPLIGAPLARLFGGAPPAGFVGFGGYAWGAESADVTRFDVPAALEGERFTLTTPSPGVWLLSGPGMDTPVRGRVGMPSTVESSYGLLVLAVAGFDAAPGTRFTLVRQSRSQTITDVQDALTVQERVKQSGVVIATLTGDDPGRVERLLSEIGRQYAAQNVARKSADAAQSLAFLEKQLPTMKRQLQEAEERFTAMRNENGTVDLPEEARLSLQQGAQASTQLLLLLQKRNELTTRFNARHPSLIALDRQIGALRAEQASVEHQIKRLPNLQQEVARLTLDVRVHTDLYTALLNNVQQLQLVKAGQVGNVRVVDFPVVPDDPVKPNKLVVIIGATLAGCVLGIAFAFMRDLVFGGITTPDEIERRVPLDVYAVVPAAPTQRKLHHRIAALASGQHLLATEAPGDPAIESLRSLRTALRFTQPVADSNALLITSAEPGVGKSFVTANLAAVLGGSGHRVVVIDADLRRGYLNQYFGLLRSPGLAEVLAGVAPVDAVLHREVAPHVDLLTSGEFPANPDALLLGEHLGSLLEVLRARYDYVLIDTPPVLVAADATMIARHVPVALMIVRAEQTRVGDLREALKRLSRGGVMPAGAVLNGLLPRLGRYGGKYGGYRYTRYEYSERSRFGWVRHAWKAAAQWRKP